MSDFDYPTPPISASNCGCNAGGMCGCYIRNGLLYRRDGALSNSFHNRALVVEARITRALELIEQLDRMRRHPIGGPAVIGVGLDKLRTTLMGKDKVCPESFCSSCASKKQTITRFKKAVEQAVRLLDEGIECGAGDLAIGIESPSREDYLKDIRQILTIELSDE